jgi:hypothetical protein
MLMWLDVTDQVPLRTEATGKGCPTKVPVQLVPSGLIALPGAHRAHWLGAVPAGRLFGAQHCVDPALLEVPNGQSVQQEHRGKSLTGCHDISTPGLCVCYTVPYR